MLYHLLSMRYIKSSVRFTWQPSNVIIHSIHDRNYTQTLAASLLVLKITHEMFYCVWRHKSKQKLMFAQVTRSRSVQAMSYCVAKCYQFKSPWERASNTIEGVKLIVARKSDHHHPSPYQNRFMNMSNICPSNKCAESGPHALQVTNMHLSWHRIWSEGKRNKYQTIRGKVPAESSRGESIYLRTKAGGTEQQSRINHIISRALDCINWMQ